MPKQIFILILSMAGGLCQSVTGFGSAIIMMTLMPELLPIHIAAGVTTIICCPLGIYITYYYREALNLKRVLLPVILFSLSSWFAVQAAADFNMDKLKALFGALLIFLSIYFFCFSDRISVKPSVFSAVVCSTLAGVMGGLFAVGGPLLVLYYLAVTDSKEEYMACVNVTLFLTNLSQTWARVSTGILSTGEISAIYFGVVGITIGFFIGNKISSRINKTRLKKLVYTFLAVTGVITLFTSIRAF